MMNIKIGRDLDSDILLSDAKASRNHALLTISRFGKMTLTDLSANGTWVNGTRLEPDVAYIVTRKDYVSFADDAEYLDWSVVPNRRRKVVLWSSLAAVLLLAVLCLGIYYWSYYKEPGPAPVPVELHSGAQSSAAPAKQGEPSTAPEAQPSAGSDKVAPASPAAQPSAAPAKAPTSRRKAKPAAKPSKPAAAPAPAAQPSAAPAAQPSAPAAPSAPAPKPRIFM